MYNVVIPKADMEVLRRERYTHPDPRIQRRIEVLLLKDENLPHGQIARIAGVSDDSVTNYIRMYLAEGLQSVMTIKNSGPASELDKHKSDIKEYFLKNPPRTVSEAIAVIKRITNVVRAPTQVRRFLGRIGMKRMKVGMIPAKADPKIQQEFKEQKLEPKIEEAKLGKRILLFVDAAHFVQGAYLGMLWLFTRLCVRGPSGRKRLNVLGALNAVTHELTTVVNDTYINAQSVCELLAAISKRYAGHPITIVLDNAKYQRCALVQQLAIEFGIELLFLPSYSPNLNLIERLWKFVKKECLYSKHYSTFAEFSASILQCLQETGTKHKSALDSLLTLSFQSFAETEILAA